MIDPGLVVDAVVSKLNANITDFQYMTPSETKTVTTIKEIAQMPEGDDYGFKPPWIGIFYSFDDDGEVIASGHVRRLPVTIGALVASSPNYKIESEALREVLSYAPKLMNYIIDEFEVNVGTAQNPDLQYVELSAKAQPIKIIQATADLALIAVWFEYFDHC